MFTVLHVVPSLASRHGGVSTSVRELCRGLARRGVGVRICTTERGYDETVDGPADAQLLSAGVRISCFPVHPWRWLGDRYAYSPPLQAILPSEIREADLVHIHSIWLHPTQAAARICRSLRRPYLVSPCGALDPYSLSVRRAVKMLYGFCIERHTLAGAAAIHFTSSLEQSTSYLFGTSRPAFVVPRCIRVDSIPHLPRNSFRKLAPAVGDRKILLFLGRIHAKKRPDLAARAFALLAARREDIQLVIAGPDEGAMPGVRRILQKGGLKNRVTVCGPLAREEKWAALQDSCLFLLPSEDENFGIAALEAMACGTPVLLSRHVGLSDAVRRGKAGLVLDQEPAAWAEAIDRLLSDPAQREEMGRAARRLAETEFETDRIAERMREVYTSIVKNGHP